MFDDRSFDSTSFDARSWAGIGAAVREFVVGLSLTVTKAAKSLWLRYNAADVVVKKSP